MVFLISLTAWHINKMDTVSAAAQWLSTKYHIMSLCHRIRLLIDMSRILLALGQLTLSVIMQSTKFR